MNNFSKVIVSWNRSEIISGYNGDYLVKDGVMIIESWIAEILVKHGYALPLEHGQALLFSYSPKEGYSLTRKLRSDSYEGNKKRAKKGIASHCERIQKIIGGLK